MSRLRRFLGLDKRPEQRESAGTDERSPTDARDSSNDEQSAYELVDAGIVAWAEGDTTLAETQLRRGVEAYRESRTGGADYALGRLGAFLVDQNRLDEAADALSEALEVGTDIPAIGADYLSLIERHKESGEWTPERATQAERTLRQGRDVAMIHRGDRAAIAFNTLARFMIGENRLDDAEREIRVGLGHTPENHDLWNALRDVMHIRRDASGLISAALGHPGVIDDLDYVWSELCQIADDSAREGYQQFAEELAGCMAEHAQTNGNTNAYWAAIGVLGRVMERGDRSSEAVDIWQSAFERGSQDPLTINRLSMHLERQKEQAAAIAIIEKGLAYGLPSNVEEQLRKRLERCRAQIENRPRKETTAFSVRTGEHEMDLLFQARVTPAIREFSVHNGVGRSWGHRRHSGSWSAWSMKTGTLLSQHEDLPRLRELQFASDGHAIGATQTGPVDECVTELGFLSPDGELIGEATLPNGLSQISSEAEGVWFVGCRDGGLYAYSVAGEHLWTWWTPGGREFDGDRYMRPCPYFVTAGRDGAIVASFGTVYGISRHAEVLWTFETSNHEPEHSKKIRMLVSPDEASPASFAELGLPTSADDHEVSTAYRQRAMETHPDRNPQLTDASERFQKVHRAYEAIMASRGEGSSGDISIEVDVSLSFGGSQSLVSNMVTSNDLTHIGTARGRIFTIDAQGSLLGEHALGQGFAVPYVASDGEIAAAWCDETLFYLNGKELKDIAEYKLPPDGVGVFADGLYVWKDKMVTINKRVGQTLWAAEFARPINAIAVDDERLVVAGGVLAALGLSASTHQQGRDL